VATIKTMGVEVYHLLSVFLVSHHSWSVSIRNIEGLCNTRTCEKYFLFYCAKSLTQWEKYLIIGLNFQGGYHASKHQFNSVSLPLHSSLESSIGLLCRHNLPPIQGMAYADLDG
jgi:hypothetical protein